MCCRHAGGGVSRALDMASGAAVGSGCFCFASPLIIVTLERCLVLGARVVSSLRLGWPSASGALRSRGFVSTFFSSRRTPPHAGHASRAHIALYYIRLRPLGWCEGNGRTRGEDTEEGG